MNKVARLHRILLGLILLIMVVPSSARVSRIMSDEVRKAFISDLQAILNEEDEELKASIPYVVNPFFFEQPLILKLKIPGGLKDVDVLQSVGKLLVDQISGAFVRGSKRFLLMKNGELVSEGDRLTRSIPEFGDLEATVTIGEISRDQFVLKLNNSSIPVDLSSRD